MHLETEISTKLQKLHKIKVRKLKKKTKGNTLKCLKVKEVALQTKLSRFKSFFAKQSFKSVSFENENQRFLKISLHL